MLSSIAQNLKRDLQTLEAEKERNTLDSVAIRLPAVRLDEESQTLLFQVLSHRYSKVAEIELVETAPDAFVRSAVMEHVKRWCKEVPAGGPRKMRLILRFDSTENNRTAFDELRDALTLPNNQVEQLVIYNVGSNHHLFDWLLRPVLQDANNALKELELNMVNQYSDEEGLAFSAGLSSQHCHLRSFRMVYMRSYQFNGALSVMDGLVLAPCLESLELGQIVLNDGLASETLARLAHMFTRPGNKLTNLALRMQLSGPNQVSALVEALANEHCVLEELDCYYMPQTDDVFLPLANVLRLRNNRLKALRVRFQGNQTATALEESLTHPNCKLQSLNIAVNFGGIDGLVGAAIANAIKVTNSNRLQQLTLGPQPVNVYRALAESLRSRCNRVTDLHILDVDDLDDQTRNQFHRALRVSNVKVINRAELSLPPFYQAFNAPFLQVLHTLLSLKHVPRLGKTAPVKRLPLQDFILQIVETLGWPLNDLRLT